MSAGEPVEWNGLMTEDLLKKKLAGLICDCTHQGMWKQAGKIRRIISEMEMELTDGSALRDRLTEDVGALPTAPVPDPKNWQTLVGQRLLVKNSYPTLANIPYETTLIEVSLSGTYGKFTGTADYWYAIESMTVLEILPQKTVGEAFSGRE